MAGLETLTGNDPSGGENPNLGDDRIRELIQKVKESISKEHTLSGYHAILSGNSTLRPSAGNVGRFYILINSGVEKELQYDNGSSWESITKNQTIIDDVAALSSHKLATILDHPRLSVKREHLASGLLSVKHFDIADPYNNASVASLVNGQETTLHTHAQATITADGRPTFLPSSIKLGGGTQILNGSVYETTLTLNGSDVPTGAVAVILEGSGAISVQSSLALTTYNPRLTIQGRLLNGNSSDWLMLIGGEIGYTLATWDLQSQVMGWRGQGTFPINTSVTGQIRKLGIRAKDFNHKTFNNNNDAWEIKLIGYI